MSIRAAAKMLEDLSTAHTASTDTVVRETAKALSLLAGDLFHELALINQQLLEIKAAQRGLEIVLERKSASN